jgi:hypothetical protein
VPNQPGWPVSKGIAGEGGYRLLAARRADEVSVLNAGEPGDRRRERPAWIGERLEPVTERDLATSSEAYPNGAYLDDALTLSVVTGGLDVDRDELAFQLRPI